MKRLFTYCFVLLAIGFASNALAQRSAIDSLNSVLQMEQNTESKVDVMLLLTREHIKIAPDSAAKYAAAAKALAEQSGNKMYVVKALTVQGSVANKTQDYEGARNYLKEALHLIDRHQLEGVRGDVLMNLGELYRELTQYNRAIKHLEEAVQEYQTANNTDKLAMVYTMLGKASQFKGEIQKAITYYEQALALTKGSDSKQTQASALGNIANLYNISGDYDMATKMFEETLVLLKEIGDKKGIAICYLNMGVSYQNKGDFEQADTIYKQALVIFQEIELPGMEAAALDNLGTLALEVNDFAKARDAFKEAIKIRKTETDDLTDPTPLINLGIAYAGLRNFYLAEFNIERGIEICKRNQNLDALAVAYHEMALVFEQKGRFDKALRFEQLHLNLSDSILAKNLDSRLTNLQNSYEAERSELELDILRSEEKILAQEQEILTKQKDDETRSWQQIGLIAAALLIIAICILWVVMSRKVRERNQKLLAEAEVENAELRQQQSEQELHAKNGLEEIRKSHVMKNKEVLQKLNEEVSQLSSSSAFKGDSKLRAISNSINESFRLDEQ